MGENGNMRRHLGVSRRDLLRRGAVVGGTLLWTVPVVSTISRAHMQETKSPAFTCCECSNPREGVTPATLCVPENGSVDTPSQCADFCQNAGYRNHNFHTSPTAIGCTDGTCANH
jgi:hypothetical protein